MSSSFKDYPATILDASAFLREIPPDVMRHLRKRGAYVSDCFRAMAEQYPQALPPEEKHLYKKRLSAVRGAVILRVPPKNAANGKFPVDTLGLIRHFVNDTQANLQNIVPCVVVTADRLLMQQIVLNNWKADIYDLTENRLIDYESFPSIKVREYMMSSHTGNRKVTDEDPLDGGNRTLYKNGGKPVKLAKKDSGSGREATMYKVVGNRRKIAKIFQQRHLSFEKMQNVQDMQRAGQELPCPWAAFPQEVLYMDPGCRYPVGYIEPYIRGARSLGDDVLLVDGLDQKKCDLRRRMSEHVEVCLQLTRQVLLLNTYGLYITDFNINNFAYGKGFLWMWDTDSYNYKRYYSKSMANNLQVSKVNERNKLSLINLATEKLYQCVFSILSLGIHPLSSKDGKFKFNNIGYAKYDRRNLFTPGLWTLFEDVFSKDGTFSTEKLLQRLNAAENYYRRHPNKNRSYQKMLGKTRKKRGCLPALLIALAVLLLLWFVAIPAVLASGGELAAWIAPWYEITNYSAVELFNEIGTNLQQQAEWLPPWSGL